MHKINLQLFADPGTGAANSGTGTSDAGTTGDGAQNNAAGTADGQTAGKTYTPEEIDKLVEEKASKKADAIRISMYQQEGMTEADAKAALNDWKAKKASEAEKAKGDLTKQQQRADEAERKLAERENQIFADLVEAKSEALAVSLGIDPAKLAYIRLDFSKVGKTDTGKPKAEDIKAVLEGALKVMPELKRSTEPIQTGVAPTNGGKPIGGAEEDALRRAFGLPPKK